MERPLAAAFILAVLFFCGRMWPKETFIVVTHGFFIFIGVALGFLTSILLTFSNTYPPSDLFVGTLTTVGALGGLFIAVYLRKGLQASPHMLAQLHEQTGRMSKSLAWTLYGCLGILSYLTVVPIVSEYLNTGTLSNWEIDRKLLALLAFLAFSIIFVTRKSRK